MNDAAHDSQGHGNQGHGNQIPGNSDHDDQSSLDKLREALIDVATDTKNMVADKVEDLTQGAREAVKDKGATVSEGLQGVRVKATEHLESAKEGLKKVVNKGSDSDPSH
jgi:hypothetical protein